MKPILITCCALLIGCSSVAFAAKPTDRSPRKGGYTYSLGLPSLYKPYAGFELQGYRPGEQGDLGGLLNLGINKDLGNPIVGAAAFGIEGYGGYRGQDFDGGGRAVFTIPSILFGAGVDYNIKDDQFDFLMRLDLTGRRGGVFGNGTTLAFRYLPTRDHTFSVGVNVPLYGKHLGKSRAKRDHVELDERAPGRLEVADAGSSDELSVVLAQLRESVHWVTRMTQPFAEVRGGDAAAAVGPDTEAIAARFASTSAEFPGGRTALGEVQTYHETLERAFALAISDGAEPTPAQSRSAIRAADVAREALLEEVLFPYNRQIGQYKKNDSLYGMIGVAQSRFGADLLAAQGGKLPAEMARRIWFVFQTLCDHIEEERAAQRERWEDGRFVWLPLQFALEAEQHDTQSELDAIIEQALERKFTRENRLWYVVNESFQWEMARTVQQARDYHVLWIHDYRGKNAEGEPDLLALAHTINYLDAMTARILEYEETRKFPTYLIVIDQHFFEINDGRRFLRVLERPLEYELNLPDEYADWEVRVADAQQRLREAVAGSTLLQLEASQYGEKWLHNYIKVHVNITNQADPSFYSTQVAGKIPVPDNNMRDHRKIAFYDITEDDPYSGLAMFTGMGIGEHYAGANWEDRAIMIQGAGALEVKNAARKLLETQGFEPEQIPWVLRARDFTVGYLDKIEAEHKAKTPEILGDRGGILQIHTETGFFDKPIEVAKGLLYSLMPPGSVLMVPDSLWQNYLYGSLLSGSSLRGCRVLVVSPAFENAPAGGASNMARAHDLMARMIVFENTLREEIEAAGGVLAIGLYHPSQDVGDISGRIRQAIETTPDWAGRVYPMTRDMDSFGDEVDSMLTAMGYVNRNASSEPGSDKPKLHLKANFFASGEGWDLLLSRPELRKVALQHTRYMAEQAMVDDGASTMADLPDVRNAPAELMKTWDTLIVNMLQGSTAEDRDRLIYYFTVGSVNLDYRSMVLNAEVMILVSSWQSLHGFMDFLLLPGLCEWVDTVEELDALLPAPGGTRRTLSNFIRILL